MQNLLFLFGAAIVAFVACRIVNLALAAYYDWPEFARETMKVVTWIETFFVAVLSTVAVANSSVAHGAVVLGYGVLWVAAGTVSLCLGVTLLRIVWNSSFRKCFVSEIDRLATSIGSTVRHLFGKK